MCRWFQVVLRGTVLRNTAFAVGLVVYTGGDTKIMRNSNVTRSKRSRIDRIVNKSIIVIFCTLLVLCTANAIAWVLWKADHKSNDWYLPQETASINVDGSLLWLTALILFNNLVRPP